MIAEVGGDAVHKDLLAQFEHPETELGFRTWSLGETSERAKVAAVVVPLLLLTAVPAYVMAIGAPRVLQTVLPVQLVLAVWGAVLAFYIDRDPSVDGVGRAVLAFEIALLAGPIYFVWTIPGSLLQHSAASFLAVLAVYMVFPNRFGVMVALGLGGTAAFGLSLLLFASLSPRAFYSVLQVLVVANAFGLITANRLRIAQRREYARLIEQQRLNAELRTLNVELEALATTDSLTGINNRRNFFALAADEIARSKRYDRPLTVLMFDIDHFKRINDTHGHAVGDAVLKAVAQMCITTLRETDVLGRLGGEEFAILLPEAEDGWEQAERLRSTLERLRTPVPDGGEVRATVSVGTATARPDDVAIDRLLGRADRALYAAKQAGRNRTMRG